MIQPKFLDFGHGGHDSIQYHFFAKDFFFAARVFRTDSIDHCSAWLFDGTVHEVLNRSDRMIQNGKNHLDIGNDFMRITAQPTEGSVKIKGDTPLSTVDAKFTLRNEFTWLDPGGQIANQSDSVIHQPDLDSEVTYRGKAYKAVGYCKRYIWVKTPRYCEWDFYHCASRDGTSIFWTADATFGDNKYNYFKLLPSGGNLRSSLENETYHCANNAYGKIGSDWYLASFSEIAQWRTAISSNHMDGMLRQRFGTMSLKCGNKNLSDAYALHENFIGTIG